jgi:hypothetical protein
MFTKIVAYHWNPCLQTRTQCLTSDCEFGPAARIKNSNNEWELDAYKKLDNKSLIGRDKLKNG